MKIDSISNVLDIVRKAGRRAVREQPRISHSDIEDKDGSEALTEMDLWLDGFFHGSLLASFPGANVVSEETKEDTFDPANSYTFVVDPLDGSLVYSYGMSGWCISVGLLDKALQPIAGVVYAPRLDLLFFADVGQKALCNKKPLPPPRLFRGKNKAINIMISSELHRTFDLNKFKGRIRHIGSAALHLCFPALYTRLYATVEGTAIRSWDIAAAHAIHLAQGSVVEYLNGDPINYSEIFNLQVEDKPLPDNIVAGPRERVRELRHKLQRKKRK
jgi:myo-inositol-1(or 4)-monophosphatase